MEISRREFRAMIFYDFKVGLTPKQCTERLKLAFVDESPSQMTVYEWFAEFKRGRTKIQDENREGRPSIAATTKTSTLCDN